MRVVNEVGSKHGRTQCEEERQADSFSTHENEQSGCRMKGRGSEAKGPSIRLPGCYRLLKEFAPLIRLAKEW